MVAAHVMPIADVESCRLAVVDLPNRKGQCKGCSIDMRVAGERQRQASKTINTQHDCCTQVRLVVCCLSGRSATRVLLVLLLPNAPLDRMRGREAARMQVLS